MKTYLDFFGLKAKPFENTRAESPFFPGRRQAEALERMLYLVRDGNMGLGMLSGEVGCGKSMVVAALKHCLRDRPLQVVALESAFGDFDETLREILHLFAVGNARRLSARRNPFLGEDRYQMLRRFQDLMENRIIRLRRHLLIILDEAQQLSDEGLNELKNLGNFGEADRNYLSIILTGQPELADKVRDLPSVDQRIGLRYHLMPLTPAEVGEYVDYRLKKVGYSGGSLFTDQAKAALHEETGGVPREINRVCKLALDKAFSQGKRLIDSNLVTSIVEDVFRQHARI